MAIAHLKDLPEDDPVALEVDGIHLVAICHAGQVRVYEGRCPHQGTLLGEGSLEGDDLVCRAHGWRFAVDTGVRVGHPAVCLQPFTAEVIDEQVWVDPHELAAWRECGAASVPQRTLRAYTDLPGPRQVPILGNVHQIEIARLHQNLEAWSREYGPMFRYKLGPRNYVGLGDPALIAEALRERPHLYRRLSGIEPVFKEIGIHGVFSAEREEWRRYRKLAMEALSNRHLRRYFPTLETVLARLKRRWERAAAQGLAVDAQKDLMRFTVDVTTNLAFGIDLNTVEDEGRALQQHLEKIFPMLARRLVAPFAYWRYVKLGPDRELDQAMAALDKIVGDLVAKTRTRMAAQPDLFDHPTNFLESMLAVQTREEASLTDAEIVGNVYTMLGAGEDTTANTLAWMIHLLCLHPDVLAKARTEVDAVLGEHTQLQDFRDAEQLVYVDAVTQETLRMRPVAPLITVLEANEDLVLGDVQLPQGTAISLIARAASQDPSHFADPHTFRPERWLHEAPLAPHHPQASMPFGSGPRLCPGRNLALLEIKCVLSMLLRNFELRHAGDPNQVEEVFAFTMMPKGLTVYLSPRSTAA
jgi:cytochrome P450/nitrite reductase/ring-hydroxylating ferredoxin subunit